MTVWWIVLVASAASGFWCILFSLLVLVNSGEDGDGEDRRSKFFFYLGIVFLFVALVSLVVIRYQETRSSSSEIQGVGYIIPAPFFLQDFLVPRALSHFAKGE
ncbi:MAG: hypothetical protein G01um1014107_72 [Parcubacteria group bacterium Gr01-1014_107]|nr:MAG: hypothetical protein G01um1014107_72 [Parcubacteria group bacterium Gr01-1014_107]